MGHLSPEELLDVAEGTRKESGVPHLERCVECRAEIIELRRMIGAVDVGVPEPSPLFWEHLSTRVREQVTLDHEVPSGRWRLAWPWGVAAAVSTAAVAIAVAVSVGPRFRQGVEPGPAVAGSSVATGRAVDLPEGPVVAASANAADAADPSLALLGDLADDLDWDAAADAGMSIATGAADGAVGELSASERVELQRLLREAMAQPGA